MEPILQKLLLAPLLIGQGLYVRRTIVRLPEPEGIRKGICGEGPPLRLLILGDSAAAGVGVKQQTEALSGKLISILGNHYRTDWQLLAKTGETTASIMALLDQVAFETVDTVLISLGVNDVTSGKSQQRFLSETGHLLHLLRDRFHAKQVIFTSLPPMGLFPALPHPLRWYLGHQSSRFDEGLVTFCQQMNCDYLDLALKPDPSYMAADGFHPGAKAYAMWAHHAAQLIHTKRTVAANTCSQG